MVTGRLLNDLQSFEELGESGTLDKVDRKQRLVDILLYVMVENNIDFVVSVSTRLLLGAYVVHVTVQ